MDSSLIESTLERIGKGYHPGAIAWVKIKRPGDWKRLIDLETEINGAALRGDEQGLTGALSQYEAFVLGMVEVFKTPKGETKNLFEGKR